MDTLAHAEVALIVDRGVKKMRVNVYKNGRINGFLRPVGSFLSFSGGDGTKWEGSEKV